MDKWLEDINKEAFTIFHHLNLFKQLGKIIDENENLRGKDQTLFHWMRKAFTIDLVIGIGRLCDDGRDTQSLVRFLRTLKKKRSYLCRSRYVGLYKAKYNDDKQMSKYMIEIGERDFDRLAGEKSDAYPVTQIDLDIKTLLKDGPCKKILDYRNEYIAHLSKVKKTKPPTYKDLYAAFEVIERTIKKYVKLLNGAHLDSLTPMPQGDWQKVLTIPWLDITQQKNDAIDKEVMKRS